MKDTKHVWNPVPGVDGYNIYLKEGSGEYVKQNDTLITASQIILEDINVNSYQSYVTAVRDGKESIPSNIQSWIIIQESIILSFSIQSVSATSITFAYSIDDGETTLEELFYDIDQDNNFISFDTSPSNSGTFEVTGLTTDQQYTLRLRIETTEGFITSSGITATPTAEVETSLSITSVVSGDGEAYVYYDIDEEIDNMEYQIAGGSWQTYDLTVQSPLIIQYPNASPTEDLKIRTEIDASYIESNTSSISTQAWSTYTDNESLSWTTVKNKRMSNSAGLLGIKSTGSGNPPSSDPNDWTTLEDDLLIPSEIWGQEAAPVDVYKIQGGIGLLFTSAAGGGVRGSIARTGDNFTWDEYNGSPVLDEFQPWQYVWRVSPNATLYDPINSRYVCYYVDARPAGSSELYYGMRAVGTAWTTDFINWTYKSDAPTITHDMLHDQYSDIIDLDNSTPETHGRVYSRNAFYYQGEYYIILEISITNDGSDFEGETICMKSPNITGPWTRVDFNGDYIPIDPIVEYDGKYYTTLKEYATVEGEPFRGAKLLRADSIFGPYTELISEPLFGTGYNGNHRETRLFLNEGVWVIVLTIRDSEDVEALYGNGARIMKLAYYDTN